ILTPKNIPNKCYSNALGVSDPLILDSLISAKSNYLVNDLPSYGRLNGTREDGWCAELNDDEQWLYVDLGKAFVEIHPQRLVRMVTRVDLSNSPGMRTATSSSQTMRD
ncbi:hypothetical protein pdam_00016280, partial [Pocillopora damicornis]